MWRVRVAKSKRKSYYVYKVTCTLSKSYYIGLTGNINTREMEHLRNIHSALCVVTSSKKISKYNGFLNAHIWFAKRLSINITNQRHALSFKVSDYIRVRIIKTFSTKLQASKYETMLLEQTKTDIYCLNEMKYSMYSKK